MFACVITILISSLPVPGQKYQIDTCEGPTTTYDKEEGPNRVLIAGRRIFCAVHDNREDINAWSTLAIAFGTIILGIFTIWVARSTKIAAAAAAKAADVAEQAILERPHIFIESIELIDRGNSFGVLFVVRNY
jgi:hypothetical protein